MKLYLITDENQDCFHVVAENLSAIENHYLTKNLPTIEEIKFIDDIVLVIP